MLINEVLFNCELEDVITELKSELQANGITMFEKTKNTSTHIQVQCPYHKNGQEKKPSAGIRKSDGMFHCFTCGEVHSLQEVITHCFGYYDDVLGMFGWKWLLKNFATMRVEERKDVDLDLYRATNFSKHKVHNSANIIGDGDRFGYVSKEELESYRYTHPYMYERKLTDEVIELFDIGYDKDTACITFPVRDVHGNTLFVARRSVRFKYFNYPKGVEKPLYGAYELHQLEKFPAEIIICESMLDCLYFWTIGKYAVALNGLGDDLQFKQLNKLPCRKFILCTDSDEAGMKARKRIRANLKNKIITEYILPEGRKDANDCTVDELKSLQEVF